MKYFFTIALIVSYFSMLPGQEAPSPIVFIYDASGSMWGKLDGKTKKEIASDVLTKTVNNLPQDQSIGLVAYGHRQKGDCEDVEMMVVMDNLDKNQVNQSIQNINPLGKTPLAYSAIQVIEQLKTQSLQATIILVTDGIESCGGNLCEVIRKAKEAGVKFKLHIIGFGLKPDETEALECAAQAGDGQYYDANDAEGLSEVLIEATNTNVDEPESNFSIYATKNGQPMDAVAKIFQSGSSKPFKSVRTYADTGHIYLPSGQYDLTVLPLENSDMEGITLTDVSVSPEQENHQTVSFDGGILEVTTTNNGEGWDSVVRVYSSSTKKQVASGRTYGRTDSYELNPGNYYLTVQAIKLKGHTIEKTFENISIKANQTQAIHPTFESGTVLIGATSSNGLVDAVVSFHAPNTNKSLAQSRTYKSESTNPKEFVLSPGTYAVKLKALGEHQGKNESLTIEVEAGKTVEKKVTF